MRVTKRILLLMLLCVSSLPAKGFKLTKPEAITAPPGWSEALDKRSLHSKTFQNPVDTTKYMVAIGVEPLHYVDSLGVLREFNFSAASDTAAGFTDAIQVGRFRVEYTPTGKLRFLRKKAYVEFFPAFDTTQVGIEFQISGKGLKANYTLDQTSPNRLAWGYDYTSIHEKEGGRGKGKIKDNAGKIRAELGELVAWDANRKPVPLTVTYTADSLIVLADTVGVRWPVTVDPTVQDSGGVNTNLIKSLYTNTTFHNDRIATVGELDVLGDAGLNTIASGYKWRLFIKVHIDTAITATSIDSVVLSGNETYSIGTKQLNLILGTFRGAPAAGWYNDFVGWSSDSTAPWNVVRLSNDTSSFANKFRFNQVGKDSVKAIISRADTLYIAAVDPRLFSRNLPSTGGVTRTSFILTKIFVNQTPTSIPGVTTLADTDTLKVNGQAIWFSAVGKVDSTGGTIDSVGVRYMRKGLSLSTNGVVKKAALAGLTATDTFSVSLASADSLTKDTLYVYQMAAHSAGGWSYSATYDTLSTYFSAPVIATNNDYDVYATGWVRANVGLTIGTLGANTVTYAAAASQKDSVIIIGVRWGIKGDATPDSTKRTWSSGIKWGTVSDTMTIPATNADTLDLDTLYYVVAFAEGSLDGRRYASFDTTWVNTGGTIPVTLSAPDFTLSSVVLSFSSSLDSTGTVPSKATTRGFVAWKREPNPATPYDGTDTLTVEQSDPNGYPYGTFSLTISGAATDTCYLFRSYATNAAGTAYGDIDSVFTYLRDLEASGVVVVPDVTPIYINGRRVNIVR